MSMDGTPDVESSNAERSITVERLCAELDADQSDDVGTPVSRIVDEATENLFGDGRFNFKETHVKASLDELLLSLVALRSSDTHGKQLLDDLAGEFDTVLSPGTVYPRLHDLCEAGVLQQRELVKTKEYTLDDGGDARATIAAAARQHLAMGMVFHAAIEQGDFE
jgi:DNA-binding PadR family transcriptional regulator